MIFVPMAVTVTYVLEHVQTLNGFGESRCSGPLPLSLLDLPTVEMRLG